MSATEPDLEPRATYASIKTGYEENWYIDENVNECMEIWEEEGSKYELDGPGAWFAEIGWYIPNMCDMYDYWDGKFVSGPYADEWEAYDVACDAIKSGEYDSEF